MERAPVVGSGIEDDQEPVVERAHGDAAHERANGRRDALTGVQAARERLTGRVDEVAGVLDGDEGSFSRSHLVTLGEVPRHLKVPPL